MGKSLSDILGDSKKEEERMEQIRQIIESVLDIKRIKDDESGLYSYADIIAQSNNGTEYMVKTLGEAILYITDEDAYSKIKESMEAVESLSLPGDDGHEISLYFRDLKREIIKRFCREFMELSKKDGRINSFLKLKMKEYYRVMDAEQCVRTDQAFLSAINDIERATLSEIMRENLDKSAEEWNMIYTSTDHRRRVREAIETINQPILVPLMVFYKKRR